MAKIQSFNAADLEFSHVGVKIVCLPQSKISDRKLDALKKSVNKFVSWEDLQSQEDTIAQFILAESNQLLDSLRYVFNSFDKDGSGSIEIEELASVAKELGVEISREQVQDAFDEADEKSDNKISFEEFVSWWKKGRKGKNKFMRKLVTLRAKTTGLINKLGTELHELSQDISEQGYANIDIHLSRDEHSVERPGLQCTSKLLNSSTEEIRQVADAGRLTADPVWLALSLKVNEGMDAEDAEDQVRRVCFKAIGFLSAISRGIDQLITECIDISYSSRPGKVYLCMKIDPNGALLAESIKNLERLSSTFIGASSEEQFISASFKSSAQIPELVQNSKRLIFEPFFDHFEVDIKAKIWKKVRSYIFNLLSSQPSSPFSSYLPLVMLSEGIVDIELHEMGILPDKNLAASRRRLADHQWIPRLRELKRNNTTELSESFPLLEDVAQILNKWFDANETHLYGRFHDIYLESELKVPQLNTIIPDSLLIPRE